ncbi:hypothetical protein V498_07801 [Pseudogymnoascus sp. VKM F-4517 (FW-2822)]|nr:hypothetical protein V498_07801 [Pseudogymnoascus sp. VKM F-4517 (FW-2822)]
MKTKTPAPTGVIWKQCDTRDTPVAGQTAGKHPASVPGFRFLNTPPHLPNPNHHKRRQPARIAHARERHQPPILAVVRLDDLASDRNPRQAADTHDRVAGGEVAPQVLGAAQLPDAHGAEEEAEDDEARHCGAGGEPDAEDHDDGEDGGEDHGVECADLVCVETRQPAPEDGPDVEDDEALVGEGLAEARVQRVAAYVRQRHEQRPLQQVDGGDGEGEDAVAEDAQVGFGAGVVLGGQAASDEHAADGEEEDGEEAEAAGCPRPADLRDEVLQHERVDDAAQGAAGGADARGEAAAELEPVPDCGEGGREDERRRGAAQDPKDEHEVPVLRAHAQQHQAAHHPCRPGIHQPPRAVLVKDRPDDNAKPKRQARVHAEDPADLALAVVLELVARDVRLERPERVHHPQRSEQRAQRPEHDQPGLQPALGVEVLVLAEGEGVGALRGGVRRGGQDGGADDAFLGGGDDALLGVVEGVLVAIAGDAAVSSGRDNVEAYCVVVGGGGGPVAAAVVCGVVPIYGGLVVRSYDLFVLGGLDAVGPDVFLLTTHHVESTLLHPTLSPRRSSSVQKKKVYKKVCKNSVAQANKLGFFQM